jgi:transcription termination factor Rho
MYLQMITPPPGGAGMEPAVATEAILQRMAKTKNNLEFLENITED